MASIKIALLILLWDSTWTCNTHKKQWSSLSGCTGEGREEPLPKPLCLREEVWRLQISAVTAYLMFWVNWALLVSLNCSSEHWLACPWEAAGVVFSQEDVGIDNRLAKHLRDKLTIKFSSCMLQYFKFLWSSQWFFLHVQSMVCVLRCDGSNFTNVIAFNLPSLLSFHCFEVTGRADSSL